MNVTAMNVSGMKANANYWFRMRAYNASGSSAYSNTASAKTPAYGKLPAAAKPSAAKAFSVAPIKSPGKAFDEVLSAKPVDRVWR